jgi:hypothetical protein
MSEFEKQFIKPDGIGQSYKREIWRVKKQGWLAAYKQILRQKEFKYKSGNLLLAGVYHKIKVEIEELKK